MPSYAEGQKRRAVDMVEECGGLVTRAMRKLGYPTRQTPYQWLNQCDASHERRTGRRSPSRGLAWRVRTWRPC